MASIMQQLHHASHLCDICRNLSNTFSLQITKNML